MKYVFLKKSLSGLLPLVMLANTLVFGGPERMPSGAGSPPVGEDPDLTFLLTFDKFSTVADYARGRRTSLTFSDDLEFRLVTGFNDKNAFNLGEDERLKYDVVDHVNPGQGTLIMWVMANNYSPGLVKNSDLGKNHKSYAYIRFKNRDDWMNLYLYQYFSSPDVYFYWNSSFSEKGMFKLAGMPVNDVREKQWFQVAVTWTDSMISIYRDGKLQTEMPLPQEAKQAAQIVPDPRTSFIAIRGRLWEDGNGDDSGAETVVDDIRLYSRALGAVEIQKQYLGTVPASFGVAREEIASIGINLLGVDEGKGPLDRLRVDLDYRALEAQWQKLLTAGKLQAELAVTRPDGKLITSTWTPGEIRESRIVEEIDIPGDYTASVTLTAPDGATETADKAILRPDTSWHGNQLGLGFEVPPLPWTPLSVSENQTVSVWGRVYRFDGKPFPQSIIHDGDELLAAPPELIIEKAGRKIGLRYKLTDQHSDQTHVEFTGVAEGDGFTLDWKTRVEFDGLIRTDFVVHGNPVVSSMRLEWTVKREFSDFVLNPLLKQSGDGSFTAPFPYSARTGGTLLWLTSEKKGFSWMPENDANWVYDPKSDNPIRVTVDERGGHCALTMINREIAIPSEASYHAMWIATPSRPLPEKSRTYRFGGYARHSNCDVSLVQHAGEGTDGVFSLKPGPSFERCMADLKAKGMDKLAIYGAATGLNDYAVEGRYFHRYWEIPGNSTMKFVNKFDGVEFQQTNPCPETSYSDYILNNIKLLLDHPDQRYVAIYYDLAGNGRCANPLHGHVFEDAFGRVINSFTIMGLRRHLMRTMVYAHSRGVDTIYHAHSHYNPAVHSFGDYWFPGEQYSAGIQQHGTPYFYSDAIPDDVFRSELNMFLKGSGVLFLGNLRRANREYGTEEHTLAMCTKFLLHDIPLSIAFEDGRVINRIWGAALKYELDDAEVTKFYHPDNRVVSSSADVKITYYKSRDGRYLVVAGNTSDKDVSVDIDFGALTATSEHVYDEYNGGEIPAPDGRVSLTIKARQFALIGL